MLDPIQIPILLKAIDFVFDEGRKLLEERRERRKTSESSAPPPAGEPVEPAPEVTPAEVQERNETKQELLTSKIDEI